jgi:hypothetical protein
MVLSRIFAADFDSPRTPLTVPVIALRCPSLFPQIPAGWPAGICM